MWDFLRGDMVWSIVRRVLSMIRCNGLRAVLVVLD